VPVRALPYALFALSVVLSVAALALALSRQRLAGLPSDLLGVLVYGLVFSAIGLLVARVRRRNVIGWIFLGSGAFWVLGALIEGYAQVVLREGAPDVLGVASLAGWFIRWGWVPAVMPAVLFVPMFFPTGRLLSRRWWPLPVVALFGAVATAASIALNPGEDERLPGIANPYGIDAPWVGVLFVIGFGAMLLALAVAAASLVIRMRRGSQLERQQLKVLFLAVLVWPVLVVLSLVGIEWPVVDVLGLLALPVAIGVAILRYRLYDIDVLINRAIVYGALSALLAATYFGAAVLLGALLRPFAAESELAVAGSTLAVVVLFAPLRSRIQRLVDERFYRAKYDAARTLDAFSARLRDQVDLDALERDVLGILDQTVQPAHAGLWLRKGPVAPASR
jgi:hypothetical protein